ncbi:MAG: glycoside hydrolase family 2 [Niabella sp.]|nr:glycoside hydrolase family 2 [Niabella sp.]
MVLLTGVGYAQQPGVARKKSTTSLLRENFFMPPDSVRPSIYWYWLSDNISVEGVKKDIAAMKAIGIGRAFIGNIGLSAKEVPYGKVPLFSPGWWEVTKAAISTAAREGIDIGMFNGPGWSQSGGPWIKPGQSMRYLSAVEKKVSGPQQLVLKPDAVPPGFQQVTVLAFPMPEQDADEIAGHAPVITSSPGAKETQQLMDGNLQTAGLFPGQTAVDLDIAVAEPFTARSLVLYPAESPFKATIALQVKDAGSYHTIKQIEFDRSNPAKNVGFVPYAPVALSFPEVTGKQFRVAVTGIQGKAGFAEIKLLAAPRIERYMEKQLAKMFQTPLPLWNEYQWPREVEPDHKSLMIDPSHVIDITKNTAPDGTLHWNVPRGNWIVVRYGMLPTGVTNSPASKEGQGLEIDKLSKAALEYHFNSFVGKVQQRLSPAERKALKWVVADSYETGSQNWTDDMITAFRKQYGYDPKPWLPVLTGRVVGSAEQSDRFLWDLRRLVADRVAYDYVGGLREVSHRHGMKLWLENYGHWGFPSEFLKYGGQTDEVAGEFWNEGSLGNIECRAASSAAHIYGKNKVTAESFTAGGLTFERYPALLKRRGDWAFTEGINNTLLHVFITQPYEDRNPGVDAGFGTEFNRKNTWFYQGKAFVDYIRRCNYMLQQGKPVNDVAYFIGEDAPKMTGVRDPELPAGYSYDYINAEVIEKRLSVKAGRLVLPDGMSYRLLVLPKLETMRPELLRKIKDLVAAGAILLGPAPDRSPSLQQYPAADKEVQLLAATLWKGVDGVHTKHARFGKGQVFSGMTMQEALDYLQLVPDMKVPDEKPPVLYAHRSTPAAEIYFITNQTDQTIDIQPEFRVENREPEWWDAVTGSARSLPVYTTKGSTMVVPLKLAAFQSGFVVFRKNTSAVRDIKGSNFPDPVKIQELTGPWTAQFDAAQRGPSAPVLFDQLTDWSRNSDERIRDYSGTAIYHTTFTVDQLPGSGSVYLDLGKLSAMAKVKLNGIDLGTVWTAPWKVEASRAVKQGQNKLEIEVVNTWVNRLIGDSKLPASERKTWSNVNPYKPDSHYQPSGLLGPVRLQQYN